MKKFLDKYFVSILTVEMVALVIVILWKVFHG